MQSTSDTGGPAFPQPDLSGYGMGPPEGQDGQYQMQGMTLRDWFAGQALMGCAQMLPSKAGNHREEAARVAYQLADAMIAERGK
jgi:hypothetical protein